MSNDEGRPPEGAPRYARLAARVLAPARRLDAEAPAPGAREAAIAALAGALAQRSARVVRRRVILGLGAAALVVLAAGLVLWGRAGRVTIRLDGGPLLATGAEVRADSERSVSLSLSTGTRLRLSDGGRVRLAEIGKRQSFVLEAGRLSAKVSPLARDHRFLIATPDAEIEVRGTAFDVVVTPGHAPCGKGVTRVIVSEGRVTVRRGNDLWQVAGGQSWPEACPAADVAGRPANLPAAMAGNVSVPHTDATARSGPPLARTRSVAVRPRSTVPATPSNLREQNDLFAAAMNARRRGDVGEARRTLDELLTRFPFGPLADSARGELAALRRPPPGAADPRP